VARFAATVWGVQLHPEVDVHILEQWADEDRRRYDEGVLEDVLRRIDAHYDDLVAGWRPLAQAFAALP
jgi:GMP synthase (glutamine-hydrolysing)